jgi:hypothetical protein
MESEVGSWSWASESLCINLRTHVAVGKEPRLSTCSSSQICQQSEVTIKCPDILYSIDEGLRIAALKKHCRAPQPLALSLGLAFSFWRNIRISHVALKLREVAIPVLAQSPMALGGHSNPEKSLDLT